VSDTSLTGRRYGEGGKHKESNQPGYSIRRTEETVTSTVEDRNRRQIASGGDYIQIVEKFQHVSCNRGVDRGGGAFVRSKLNRIWGGGKGK